MAAVFARPLHLAQELRLRESLAAVLGGDAMQTAPRLHTADGHSFVDHDIEAVERPQETMRAAEWNVERFDLCVHGLTADRGRCDTIERAVLIRNDEAAFRIDAHVDPGA